MRVTLVGPGAIGGVMASRLQRSGFNVHLVASARGAASIRKEGLRVFEDGKLHVTQPQVVDEPSQLGIQDLLFICLKGHQLADAAHSLAPLIDEHTLIVSAQNGIPWWFLDGFGRPLQGMRLTSIDAAGEIAAALPPAQCLGCVVYLASRVDAQGVVQVAPVPARLVIGDPVPGTRSAGLARVSAMLSRAGFTVQGTSHIQREIWRKLWGNLTMNPLSALTGATIDRLVADPQVRALTTSMMEEARHLAAHLGIDLGLTTAERLLELEALGAVKTSMLQDVEAGRTPEVDAIIGAVAEIGDRLGIETPFIDAVLGLMRNRVACQGRPWLE